MEVKMNKEIRDYQEAMFWGLSFRQCLFSVLAILAALGIYFITRKYAVEQVTGWLCVLGAAPFAACGFFRYHGMTAEQFVWADKTSVISVWINPGAIAFTVIPRLASSRAIVFVRPMIPAFEAA